MLWIKGFKNSPCKNHNSLGCSTDPPILSATVVRDLGASFCKMDLASLTDESLNAKPIKKGAVVWPMTKKAKTSSDTDVSADQEVQGVVPSKD